MLNLVSINTLSSGMAQCKTKKNAHWLTSTFIIIYMYTQKIMQK